MRKGTKKKVEKREAPVIKRVNAKLEGEGAAVVPGVTDEDPNTSRRITKTKK